MMMIVRAIHGTVVSSRVMMGRRRCCHSVSRVILMILTVHVMGGTGLVMLIKMSMIIMMICSSS